jgi:hypothetical protein
MYKKVYFLDSEDWDEGMRMLVERIDRVEQKGDEDIIESLGASIL